jgi:hypothetical protein
MVFLKRNIVTTILILPYFYWWYYLIDWFESGGAKYPNSCGAANAGMLVITLLIVACYSFAMIINIIFRDSNNNIDYVKFLIIILAPLIMLYIFFTTRYIFFNQLER